MDDAHGVIVRSLRDRDPEPVIAALNEAGHEVSVHASARLRPESHLEFVRLPRLELFRIGFPRFRASNESPIEFTGITLPASTDFRSAGDPRAIETGHCHVMHKGQSFDLQAEGDGDMFVINFRDPMADAVSEALHGRERLDLRSPAGDSFQRFAHYTWNEARAGNLPESGIVLTQIEDLLQSLLVKACASSATAGRTRVRAVPAYVHAAREFVEANLTEALTLAAVSSASGVSSSTLTRGFRHHVGMGPIAYVRRRRLLRARDALLRAEDAAGAVTRVAIDCGFTHLSRFAKAYGREFGELPSETLRR